MASYSVRIRNTGTVDFTAKYDNQPYTIPAGSETIVPWDAACLWLGDPRLWDDHREKNRRAEYNRLCVRYGAYSDHAAFLANIPSLEVHKIDGGRIPMLVEDPFGGAVNVWDTENQDTTVEAEVAYLRAQVQQLLAGDKNRTLPDAPADPEPVATPTVAEDPDGLPVDGDGEEPIKIGEPPAPARTTRTRASASASR